MRIVDIRERSVPISRYNDPSIVGGDLTTSVVALVTDILRNGQPVVGYGFSSFGRFAQSGLIKERFAPRLLKAGDTIGDDGGTNLDPFKAWTAMMKGEKPGGHGERCVAVGTLDMALWDAAAKVADVPLYEYVRMRMGLRSHQMPSVSVYAGGGYPYPHDDIELLKDEIREMRNLGFTRVKIKIGSNSLDQDLRRIDAAVEQLARSSDLAVDAMNAYDSGRAISAALTLGKYGLWWLEDICDPHDLETLSEIGKTFPNALAAGEALFSAAEANLLSKYGGMRRDKDILLFDPVHCYGIPGYLQIIDCLEKHGWPRSAFWPHGGHLFSAHLAAALNLGGAELNPFCFAPFGGSEDYASIIDGRIVLSDVPGIGFEAKPELYRLLRD